MNESTHKKMKSLIQMIHTTTRILLLVSLLRVESTWAFSPSSNVKAVVKPMPSTTVAQTNPILTEISFATHRLERNKYYPTTSSQIMTQLRFGKEDDPENINVNVNEIGNIDAVTLTAVGFGLIAFNFLIFANMGDAGVGGLVARIINTFQ